MLYIILSQSKEQEGSLTYSFFAQLKNYTKSLPKINLFINEKYLIKQSPSVPVAISDG